MGTVAGPLGATVKEGSIAAFIDGCGALEAALLKTNGGG